MRTMTLSDDELDLLFEVLDTACEAVASDFDLLDAEGAAPREDEEVELDEGQAQALEWLQRVIGLRERLETQSVLGGR
ncbi:MAG: hypothetical protein OZ948_11525 [Deltaproteobacteria bacterium]|nr:hypothetical protein [Deltaproteobacteria bacterium]